MEVLVKALAEGKPCATFIIRRKGSRWDQALLTPKQRNLPKPNPNKILAPKCCKVT